MQQGWTAERAFIAMGGMALTLVIAGLLFFWECKKQWRWDARMRIAERFGDPTGWEEMDAINAKLYDYYHWRNTLRSELSHA
jgi:hypothetical protein